VSFEMHTGSRHRVLCCCIMQPSEKVLLVYAGMSMLRAPPGASMHQAKS
jgi:hypothetical protein